MIPIDLKKNENGCPEEAEEDRGVHQLPPGAGHEVRQVRAGIQADPQDPEAGQGQARHHWQQHPATQVRTKTEAVDIAPLNYTD